MGNLFCLEDIMLAYASSDYVSEANLNVFEWDEVFETGIPEIDYQHKKLVELANDVIREANDPSGEITSVLLQRLLDYTAYHFGCEESWMRQFGVSHKHIERHALVHQKFVQHVNTWIESSPKIAVNFLQLVR